MTESYAVVVTTINKPTGRPGRNSTASSPASARCFTSSATVRAQTIFCFLALAIWILMRRDRPGLHSLKCARPAITRAKNIGYLAAARDGATVIIETDDDNIPREGFWSPRQRNQSAPLVTKSGWCNVYSYFSPKLYGRGVCRSTSSTIKSTHSVTCKSWMPIVLFSKDWLTRIRRRCHLSFAAPVADRFRAGSCHRFGRRSMVPIQQPEYNVPGAMRFHYFTFHITAHFE